ncbi:MAG: NINE protein [Bacteroidetes bacterium]|nr:NINE protein [Bacteroidota bacterium]
MKDKNVSGFLALFFGWLGFHRFYLGQIGLGIIYCLLLGTGISFLLGLIDAVAFFVMDKDNFDIKYNRRFYDERRRRRDTDYVRRKREETDFNRGARAQRRRERDSSRELNRRTRKSRPVKKVNSYKTSGKEKYKDYDYKGAIVDFEKSLEVEPNDPAVHFNLACAYSLEENVQKSLQNLALAVANGFKDFTMIQEHDALAFVRIQSEFEAFVENKYRLPAKAENKDPKKAEEATLEEDLLSTQPDLLDQIKKLGELRDNGMLTEDEFAAQKKKLLG